MSNREILTPVEGLAPIPTDQDEKLLVELDSAVIAPLLNRHINPSRYKDSSTKDEMPTVSTYMGDNSDLWTPALLVPWSAGRNFPKDYSLANEKSQFPDVVRSTFWVGLLTEDNLPWYTQTISGRLGSNEALEFWNRIWTGEEDRHAEVMRSFIHVSRMLDPILLEKARINQLVTAEVPRPDSTVELAVYVTFQELATRISHYNSGLLLSPTSKLDDSLFPTAEDRMSLANMDDEVVRKLEPEEMDAYFRQVGRTIMNRVAADETKHFVFYRDLVNDGYIPLNPSLVVRAIERQVRTFAMPGTGIENFDELAMQIANAGVYDLDIHINKIIKPVLKYWDFENLTGLDDEAERSRERTLLFIDQQAEKAKKQLRIRDKIRQRTLANGETGLAWIGLDEKLVVVS